MHPQLNDESTIEDITAEMNLQGSRRTINPGWSGILIHCKASATTICIACLLHYSVHFLIGNASKI